ncbi:MAG: hypothetical protein ACQUHE_01225 [Bacteroidia bacterium]
MNRSSQMKAMLCCALLFLTSQGYAQVYNTVNSPSKTAINSRESLASLVGEPYLYKDFKKAFVRFANANTSLYEVKYDQLADELIVKGEGDQEFAFSDPILEFKFQESKKTFRSGFAPTSNKTSEKSFYEILFDGNVKYIKRASKVIIEAKEYNGPSIKKIDESNAYFIVKPGAAPEPVKNNEKSILSVLAKPELAAYVKTNKLNLKNDEDVAKLLAYNDSL